MAELLSVPEPWIRLAAFGAVFAAMALWELLAPRRSQVIGRLQRWPSNLGIVVLDTLTVRLIFPAAAVGMALLVEARGWGLFNFLSAPSWLAVPASVALLDFAVYLQHRLFHAVPALWRLHRMHHADLEIDVTTGARFHPIEILLSLVIKFGVVIALGAPAVSVLAFEVLLNATSMFNHGNVRLPLQIDRLLRRIVVTPDMHRVHHSILPRETNSNFGFNLPWWDCLLGTYRAQPAAGHTGMTIGIELFRDPGELRLDRMLLQPFRKDDRPRRPSGAEIVSWIDAGDLAARLDGAARPLIVDVRGRDEFGGALGHLQGARNIPLDELRDRLAELRDAGNRPIALVCRTQMRSAKAASLLKAAGFGDVHVLRGGMERWNHIGLPVEGQSPRPTADNF